MRTATLIISLTTLILSFVFVTGAQATTLSPTEQATSSVLIRQVLRKSLLPNNFQKKFQEARLLKALVGTGNSDTIEIQTLNCEKSGESYDCSMDIYSKIGGVEAIEILTVKVYEGTVRSARMEPAPVG